MLTTSILILPYLTAVTSFETITTMSYRSSLAMDNDGDVVMRGGSGKKPSKRAAEYEGWNIIESDVENDPGEESDYPSGNEEEKEAPEPKKPSPPTKKNAAKGKALSAGQRRFNEVEEAEHPAFKEEPWDDEFSDLGPGSSSSSSSSSDSDDEGFEVGMTYQCGCNTKKNEPCRRVFKGNGQNWRTGCGAKGHANWQGGREAYSTKSGGTKVGKVAKKGKKGKKDSKGKK